MWTLCACLGVRVNWYSCLAKHGINSEYNPSRFHAIIQRCRLTDRRSGAEVSITANTFHSGRVVLTGATSADHCRHAALKICRRINHAVYWDMKEEKRLRRFAVYRLRIENVVCAYKLPHRLGLENLDADWQRQPQKPFNIEGWNAQRVIYRPTTFSGLRLIFEKKNATGEKGKLALMLFISGNVTISGMKDGEELKAFAEELNSRLLSKYERIIPVAN